jgi:hypothetical protein
MPSSVNSNLSWSVRQETFSVVHHMDTENEKKADGWIFELEDDDEGL